MSVICPVCLNEEGSTCSEVSSPGFDGSEYKCSSCGHYRVSRSLEVSLNAKGPNIVRVKRASMSHVIRARSDAGETPLLTTADFGSLSRIPDLPTPPQQAKNALRIIGDYEKVTGGHLSDLPDGFFAQIGSLSRARAVELCRELLRTGLIKVKDEADTLQTNKFARCALSFKGWEGYEAEMRGRLSGDYGFIAMKFGDPVLDSFLTTTIRPAVESVAYKLVDMRDVAQAGVIDNILRVQIRDAAFVLVDLTHDNYGAYWEAGYAEGIGKPVIYLCEKNKFDLRGTHFDTNHLTTVPWEVAKPEDFSARLVATLKNTLSTS